VFIYTNYYFR